MNFIIKVLALTILTISSNLLFSQQEIKTDRDYKKETIKMYDYEFSGKIDSDKLEDLRKEIALLKFVTQAKIFYKDEKSTGMVRVTTSEIYTNKETEFEFNIFNLKMLITKFNLDPIEFRSEIISK